MSRQPVNVTCLRGAGWPTGSWTVRLIASTGGSCPASGFSTTSVQTVQNSIVTVTPTGTTPVSGIVSYCSNPAVRSITATFRATSSDGKAMLIGPIVVQPTSAATCTGPSKRGGCFLFPSCAARAADLKWPALSATYSLADWYQMHVRTSLVPGSKPEHCPTIVMTCAVLPAGPVSLYMQ